VKITNPDGTKRLCRCGHVTVLAEHLGRKIRVHTGTWTTECKR